MMSVFQFLSGFQTVTLSATISAQLLDFQFLSGFQVIRKTYGGWAKTVTTFNSFPDSSPRIGGGEKTPLEVRLSIPFRIPESDRLWR